MAIRSGILYDNCPNTTNQDQLDSNGDGVGDACTVIPDNIYYVNPTASSTPRDGTSWAKGFATIQEGIDAADLHNISGWTGNPSVWVKAGTYLENIVIWHGVRVYGGFAGTESATTPLTNRDLVTNQTIIDGQGLAPTVTIAHLPQDRYFPRQTPPALTATEQQLQSAYDSQIDILDGFTVRNGAGELGGGVSVYKEFADIDTDRLENNTAALGGGVYFYKSFGTVGDDIGPFPGNYLAGSTTISFDTANGVPVIEGFGGAVYTEGGAPTIFANIIQGNKAYYGAGIAARASAPLINFNLIGCCVTADRNVADINGTGGFGGAIYEDSGSDIAIDRDTIVRNVATGQGGGIVAGNAGFTMDNTIVAFNTSPNGGAIWAASAAPIPQVITYPLCYITYSDFYQNAAPQFVGIADPSAPIALSPCALTNLALNPQFVHETTCNYHLFHGPAPPPISPLIGAGDPADANLINGTIPNIGAFQDVDPPVTIQGAQNLVDGTTVEISNVVVTAVFPDAFYIQNPDRTAGIKVLMSNAPVSEGEWVSITGVISTSNGERQIVQPSVTISFTVASIAAGPLGVSNRQLGGSPIGGPSNGVNEGVGLNNVGLLVRTWGNVTNVVAGTDPRIIIDDGSRVGVTILVPTGTSLPTVGSTVTVTGVSTIDLDVNGNRNRAIRMRRSSDLGYPR